MFAIKLINIKFIWSKSNFDGAFFVSTKVRSFQKRTCPVESVQLDYNLPLWRCRTSAFAIELIFIWSRSNLDIKKSIINNIERSKYSV